MDKQKIYIIVIVVCLAVTGGVLFWGFGSSSKSGSIPTVTVTNIDGPGGATDTEIVPDVANIPNPNAPNIYQVPSVFPGQPELDLAIFESSQYNNLTDYTPLTVQPEEIGRENPFIKY